MNLLITVQSRRHLPYIATLISEVEKNGGEVFFAIDSRRQSKEFASLRMHNSKLLVVPFSNRIMFYKNYRGCLQYLNSSCIEVTYFDRQRARSNLRLSTNLLLMVLSRLPFSFRRLFVLKIMDILEHLIEKQIKASSIDDWLKKNKVTHLLVLGGNYHNSIEDTILFRCKRLNIKSFVYSHTLDNCNSKSAPSTDPDFYLVWNNHHLNTIVTLRNFPVEKIGIVGSGYHENVIAHLRKSPKRESVELPGWKIRKDIDPYLLYLGSSINVHSDESSFLLNLINNSSLPKGWKIKVRPHPANFQTWSLIADERFEICYQKEEFENLDYSEFFNLADAAFGVFGINTSAFLDVVSMGIPVAAITAITAAQKNVELVRQRETSHFAFLEELGLPIFDNFAEILEFFSSGDSKLRLEWVSEVLPYLGNTSKEIYSKLK